ncbi:MAG TPA: hypothetical protein VF456_26755 [Vicinamibacterales bacterium]
MKSTWPLVLAAVVMATSPAAPSQALYASARDILNTERSLQPAEIAAVLAAVRQAVSGKTFRLSYVANGPGPEVLMGANGRPHFVRAVSGSDYSSGAVGADGNGNRTQSQQSGHVDVITFTEYTGRSATTCDGTALDAELVIEYEHKSSDDRWTVKVRTRTAFEFGATVFDMLAGITPVESGNRRSFDGRIGRALVAPWKLPAGAQGGPPAGTSQSIWIDTVSLLPLRWTLSIPAMPDRGIPAIPDYGLSFSEDASLVLQPPDATLSNDCVR